MFEIFPTEGLGISEYCCGFLEGDSMLRDVDFSLSGIPGKHILRIYGNSELLKPGWCVVTIQECFGSPGIISGLQWNFLWTLPEEVFEEEADLLVRFRGDCVSRAARHSDAVVIAQQTVHGDRMVERLPPCRR